MAKQDKESIKGGEEYYIPSGVVLANFFHSWVFIPLFFSFVLISVLLLVLISTSQFPSYVIPYPWNILFFGLFFGSILLSAISVLLFPDQAYPTTKKWIIENIRCPKCNGEIKTCYIPASTPFFYVVQCKKCNKESRFFYWQTIFISHLTLADDETYVYTWPYHSSLYRLFALFFLIVLLILIIVFTVYYYFNPLNK
jgi:hypothetical protein